MNRNVSTISAAMQYANPLRTLNGLNCADVSLNNIHPPIHPSTIHPYSLITEIAVILLKTIIYVICIIYEKHMQSWTYKYTFLWRGDVISSLHHCNDQGWLVYGAPIDLSYSSGCLFGGIFNMFSILLIKSMSMDYQIKI